MKVTPSSTLLYFDSIKDFLKRNPIILDFKIVRERIASTEGFIEINANLQHGYRFILFEYYSITDGVLKYRYQLVSSQNQPIVRWDNAPHHPELNNFPHHKHIGNMVEGCHQFTIYQIFNQINEYIT